MTSSGLSFFLSPPPLSPSHSHHLTLRASLAPSCWLWATSCRVLTKIRRSVIAGDHTFVFVQKGVINLACVSRTREPASQLAQQLNYMYSQILSILTGGVLKIFEKRAQFDLRSLLGGSAAPPPLHAEAH